MKELIKNNLKVVSKYVLIRNAWGKYTNTIPSHYKIPDYMYSIIGSNADITGRGRFWKRRQTWRHKPLRTHRWRRQPPLVGVSPLALWGCAPVLTSPVTSPGPDASHIWHHQKMKLLHVHMQWINRICGAGITLHSLNFTRVPLYLYRVYTLSNTTPTFRQPACYRPHRSLACCWWVRVTS